MHLKWEWWFILSNTLLPSLLHILNFSLSFVNRDILNRVACCELMSYGLFYASHWEDERVEGINCWKLRGEGTACSDPKNEAFLPSFLFDSLFVVEIRAWMSCASLIHPCSRRHACFFLSGGGNLRDMCLKTEYSNHNSFNNKRKCGCNKFCPINFTL